MKKKNRIILLLIALILLSTYNPHHFQSIVTEKKNFFSVQNIIIENNFIIEEKKIREKLEKIYKKNIFLINKKDIEKPMKTMDFFEKAEVRKKYPNTVYLKIFETKPIAIIIKNKKKYILDSSSNLIIFKEKMAFDQLPNIIGDEAEKYFVKFFNLLKSNNFLIKKIKSYHYFQIGRWDVHLENDKIIKFPYDNIEYAIKKSIELLDHKEFENYNIIDLRVNGKIIVE